MSVEGEYPDLNGQYSPLHPRTTIRESPIHGLGLFAIQYIPFNFGLGVARYALGDLVIRTPLGGFINHNDDDPNVMIYRGPPARFPEGWMNTYYVHTLVAIYPGDEITARYTLYKPPPKPEPEPEPEPPKPRPIPPELGWFQRIAEYFK